MNVLIFGAGKAGKFLCDEIQAKCPEILHITAFADNKLGGQYRDIPIVKPSEILPDRSLYDAVFVAAGAQKTVKIAIDTIIGYGVDEIYMLHDIAGKNQISPFAIENGEAVILPQYLRKIRFSQEKPTLPYMEIPVTDQCNLNCKGCLFACNALGNGKHIPYEQIAKDAKRMRELFYDIPWIRILGGEPLMHPNIEDILRMYRETYPDSEIDLCTNGLLLPKMPESFYDCLRENHVTVHVSGYTPTYRMLETFDAILKQHHLNYTILKRDLFFKFYTEDDTHDAEKQFLNCPTAGCRELYNGKLLRCSAVIAFEKFNRQFGTHYVTRKGEDWLDIHDPDTDGWKLKERIDRASDICAYCDVEHSEKFGWETGGLNATLEDYLI